MLRYCPQCGEPLDVPESDGTVLCPECYSWWAVEIDYDLEPGRLPRDASRWRRLDPPSARDVQGDLRYHEDKGC